jgi:hypothetical protein
MLPSFSTNGAISLKNGAPYELPISEKVCTLAPSAAAFFTASLNASIAGSFSKLSIFFLR